MERRLSSKLMAPDFATVKFSRYASLPIEVINKEKRKKFDSENTIRIPVERFVPFLNEEGIALLTIITYPFVLTILYLPSIIYRWSLKSTSIIWSPLLWVIVSARTIGPVKFRLNEICHLALYRAMRLYSVIILLAFVWKLTIWLGPQTVALNTDLMPLLEPYIEPARLPIWQISSASSALLAFGLYFLADWHLRSIEAGKPNRSAEQTIKRQIGATTVVRNSLALYAITCTLYIAWKVSGDIEWPVLEFILFPW